MEIVRDMLWSEEVEVEEDEEEGEEEEEDNI